MARIWALDSLRGFAVALMLIFNWSFALKFFNVYSLDAGWLYWWLFPRFIGFSFLFIAGASLALSWEKNKDYGHFVRRATFLFSLGLLITLATWLLFPQEFIFFGVLHLLGAATLLSVPVLSRPRLAGLLGVSWMALTPLAAGIEGEGIPAAVFGLSVQGLNTLDYFPLLPWAGVVFLGAAFGRIVGHALRGLKEPAWSEPLAFLGKNSLLVYLLHQPLLVLALNLAGFKVF